MGLKLAHTLQNGISGDHWSISDIRYSQKQMSAEVTITLYKDAQTKADGKPPLPIYKIFRWEGSEFPFDEASLKVLNATPTTIAYTKIKTQGLVQDEYGNYYGDIDWTLATDED